MSKLPDFIIIGAGKCGTTSLYDYFSQHPEVYLCPKKETYFFVNEPVRSKLKPWGAITDIEDYASLFKDAPSDKVVGEISTTYYMYPDAAKLIGDRLPNVKIIAILRNPADRAFSDYQMHVRNGNEKLDFSRVITNKDKYIKQGFYYRELMPFYQVFSESNIKILLFDDLCQDPNNFMRDLYKFIGIDPDFNTDTARKSREGGMPKNKAINTVLTKKNPIRNSIASVLKLFMPLETRQKIRSKLIKNNIYKAKLSPEDKKELIEIYRSDVIQLQGLIKRDLSDWLSC